MNFLARLNIFRYIPRLKPSPSVANFTRQSITGLNIWSASNLLLCGTLFGNKIKEEKAIAPPVTHETLLKEGCMNSEIKVNELIKSLELAITDTCEKYRVCLMKQVDIIEKGMHMDPLSEYWDNLVTYRVEADNLKKEFETYRSMVEYMGQLAFNLALCSALIGNLDAKDYVCDEFFQLEKISHEQIAENKKIEATLLQVNMKNIMHTTNVIKSAEDIAQGLKKM